MSFTLTPNMNLPLPNPAGTPNPEPGPQYAADQNQAYTILDGHNHSSGSGVPITPAGLNINTNLSFENNDATNVYGIQFSSPAGSANMTFLYTNAQSGGGVTDLFYNDGAGNVIALTKAGAVNATIASIPGESYAGGTFTWKQGAGSTTPANFDIGSVTIRPVVAGTSSGVVLSPPSAISSQYNVQLPTVPGTVTSIMQMNTSGDMLSSLVQDNSTIVIASQVLKVGVIQTANIADGAVTQAKMSGFPANLGTVTTFNSNGPYTVPSGVTQIYVIACGGGGGGGGGGRNSGTSDSVSGGTAGGGGGGGAEVWEGMVTVTPGDTLAITIGTGGGGGGAGSAGSTGGTGSTGNPTTIVNGSSVTILSTPGGTGGTGGVGTTTNGAGGAGGQARTRAGGAGTNGTVGVAQPGGASYLLDIYLGQGGTGGSVGVSGHGFGAAGGGSIGTGGTGAASASSNTGGGGGGGNGGTTNNAASAGGSGGSGYLAIYIV